MSGYQAGHPELVRAASQMAEANSNLQGELSQLAGACDTVSASWGGTAATAFQNMMQAFQRDAKTLNDSLLNISEQVSASADAYAAQEEEANASVSNIMNTLNG